MKDAFLGLNFLAAWIALSFPIDIMSFPFEARMLIPYRTGWYGQNSSYQSMNRYRNTFKMYRFKIPAYTGQYRLYRSIPDVSADTKIERKNRRNAWFEQTPVQQVATTLTSPIRSSSSFFFSSSRLLSFSIALFLLNNERCYVVSPSLFCAIWNFLSPFTRD